MVQSCPMTHSKFLFEPWQEPNFRAVNKFYRSQKHKGSASGDEQVFVAWDTSETENTLIGAVRLVPYEDYFWLRSLYIHEDLRGHGLGHELLRTVQNQITLPIHCFPYGHLNSFYSKAGYVDTPKPELPQSLQQLYDRYSNKDESLLIMSLFP